MIFTGDSFRSCFKPGEQDLTPGGTKRYEVYTSTPKVPLVYIGYPVGMSENTSVEIGIKEFRESVAAVLNEVAVRGQITYLTNRGQRYAAIVPVPVAEAAERARKSGADSPA